MDYESHEFESYNNSPNHHNHYAADLSHSNIANHRQSMLRKSEQIIALMTNEEPTLDNIKGQNVINKERIRLSHNFKKIILIIEKVLSH